MTQGIKEDKKETLRNLHACLNAINDHRAEKKFISEVKDYAKVIIKYIEHIESETKKTPPDKCIGCGREVFLYNINNKPVCINCLMGEKEYGG